MHYFSKSTLGFYDTAIQSKASIPADAVEISEAMRNGLAGKMLTSDSNGFPVEVIPTMPTVADILCQAKNEIRAIRTPILNAVNGIGWRAERSGDEKLAKEALLASKSLLDVTDDLVLNSVDNIDDMRNAGIAAIKRIADGLSEGLSKAFKV